MEFRVEYEWMQNEIVVDPLFNLNQTTVRLQSQPAY